MILDEIEKWIWVAGLLEGEGSFFLSKQGYPAICCTMTDEDIIQRLHYCTGVGHVNGPYHFGNKPVWAWRCSKKADCAMIISKVYRYMGERRRKQIDQIKFAMLEDVA